MRLMGIIIFILLSTSTSFAIPTKWRSLEPGIDYTTINQAAGFPTGAIHAFRIDLKYFHLDLALTHNNQRPLKTVKNLVQEHGAVIGINGGFFSPTLMPLGLRIKQGQILYPLKNTSWWGVFIIKNNKARIMAKNTFQPTNSIKFAIQAGPRLIINGSVPSLKGGFANRSALGITKKGKLIIAVTDNLLITTTTFAKILKQSINNGGLDCYNAINLDGGSSSQLYAQTDNFNLYIPSFSPVADVILVVPKERP